MTFIYGIAPVFKLAFMMQQRFFVTIMYNQFLKHCTNVKIAITITLGTERFGNKHSLPFVCECLVVGTIWITI